MMAGTKRGGELAAITNKARHGDDFYQRMGAKGGKAVHSKPRGFAARPDIVHAAAKKGGLAAKRKREQYSEHFSA